MVSLQSEGTRVLVNVIKGVFSLQAPAVNGISPRGSNNTSPVSPVSPPQPPRIDETERKEAIAKIATLDSTEPLVEMVARSGRYPILLHEGVVALTLLSSQSTGLPCVVQSLLAPLPYHLTEAGLAVAPATGPSGSTRALPATQRTRTSCPLDMLVVILNNPNGNFPPELGANTCTLLASLTQGPADEVEKIKQAAKGALEKLAAGPADAETTPTGVSQMLRAAAKKTLGIWGYATSP